MNEKRIESVDCCLLSNNFRMILFLINRITVLRCPKSKGTERIQKDCLFKTISNEYIFLSSIIDFQKLLNESNSLRMKICQRKMFTVKMLKRIK